MTYIRFFTDPHLPPEPDGTAANDGMERRNVLQALEVFAGYSKRNKPDLVIGGGDNIASVSCPDAAARLQKEVSNIFYPLYAITRFVPGNKDTEHWRPGDLCARHDLFSSGEVIRFPDASVVLWPGDVQTRQINGENPARKYYEVSGKNLQALNRMLAETAVARPVLLFTHIPPETDAARRPIDAAEKRNPERTQYRNAEEVLRVLVRSGRKIFVVAGHRHVNWNARPAKNVRIVTFDRLFRHEAKNGRPAGHNYGDIRVYADAVTIRQGGVANKKFEFAL
jgi:hypothetical protein